MKKQKSKKVSRPVTTGSRSTPQVQYRVSAAQRAELAEEAERLGVDGPNAAAKRRAFPVADGGR